MNYNSVFQDEIDAMNKFRYSLLKTLNEEKNTPEKREDLDYKIDELAKEIEKYIKLYFDQLPIDFIMEQLANLGQCPNLLNDDNGHWAVTCDGYQNVVFGDEPADVETSFFVVAKDWKNTPREALLTYLNEE